MDISRASELLTTLQSQTDKKSEKKVYTCFLRILESLKIRDLAIHESQLISDSLFSLQLETPAENKKKYYRKKLCEFKDFLRNEFSFTTEKHYTEIWTNYGMSLGAGIGLSIGIAIDPALGSSFGMSIGIGIGMVLGMMYGSKKDAEAKREGRVI